MSLFTVYAQAVPKTLSNPLEIQNIGQIFAMVINIILGVGWALVFVMLALGFVQYVMSRGEKTAVKSAQDWLTYAVIGGVGLFLVTALKTIIPQLIGAKGTPGGEFIELGGTSGGGSRGSSSDDR